MQEYDEMWSETSTFEQEVESPELELVENLQAQIWERIGEKVDDQLRYLVEEALRHEAREAIGADRYERTGTRAQDRLLATAATIAIFPRPAATSPTSKFLGSGQLTAARP